ncbi:MAG: 2-hydroxychromene-2-carboxylate isomerase [Burkholderiaceae bacterium]
MNAGEPRKQKSAGPGSRAGDPPRVALYFDFLSPFAYLAQHRLRQLASRHGWSIEYHAIDLGSAKLAVGNTGPSNRDMPIKLAYLKNDLQRWAGLYGVPLLFPPNFNSQRLNAGLTFPDCAGHEADYVRLAFEQVWALGRAPDSDDTVDTVAAAMGWEPDRFVTFVDGDGRAALAEATREAIDQQIFGVPTMVADGQMWWGNDRIFMLERHLSAAPPDAVR